MLKILLIFALLMFLSCQEETVSRLVNCDRMTFSDALPVQFWLSECDTFNEHEAQGVHHICWCQPWNSGDEILIQFQHDTGEDLVLLAIDSTDEILFEEPIVEIASGIYQCTLITALIGQIRLVIARAEFETDYITSGSGFIDDGLPTPFLISPYELNGKILTSQTLSVPVPNGTNTDLKITIAAGTLRDFSIYLYNVSNVIFDSIDFGDVATGVHTQNFVASQAIYKIGFFAKCNDTVNIGKLTTIILLDASTSTLVNATAFNVGWANIDNGGTVNWTLGAAELSATVGAFPNDLTDWARSPSFAAVGSGSSVSGNITHNIALGLNGQLVVQMWNGSNHETIWSANINGTGSDVNVSIPPYVMVQSGNVNIEIYFIRTTGSGLVARVKDIFIEVPAATYVIPNGDFQGTFSDWTQSGTGYTWTQEYIGGTDGAAVLTVASPIFGLDYTYTNGTGSNGRAKRTGLSIPADNYKLIFNYNQSGGTTTRFLVEFRNGGSLVTSVTTDVTGGGTYINNNLIISSLIDNIRITAESLSGSGLMEITSIELAQINEAFYLAKSDCLDFQTETDETILVNYSNARNFDGLVYTDVSPDISFNIRIPCRFFHEQEPEEDEAMELSSSVITTSAQVKTQRLLEIKHVPYYFHKKLRRVLKHQNVTIFDKLWKKEEKYEVNEGRKTWPLKSATCLLTEKNSLVRNIL
jgi:hypothetical protein